MEGYGRELIENVEKIFGRVMEIVRRPDAVKKLIVLPERWIVAYGLKTLRVLAKTTKYFR